jgi:hypothetical protein
LDVDIEDLINFGKFCKTTTLFKTTGKISNFIKGEIVITSCEEDQAWKLYDLFGIECFQPNAELHIYCNTEKIFLIGPSQIAEGGETVKYEPLVLSANRKKINYYVMYTRDDSSSSGQISIDDIGSVDMRISAEIVGDYEVLQINSVENGANDRPFTIYANHGIVTARINVTLTKRVYSGSFVIEDANGVQYVPNSAQSIVLTGLDQIHKLTVVEPNGDGRYNYSTVVDSKITNYANFTQDELTSPIINCEITSQPGRVATGSLKVTCKKLIDPAVV